MSPTEGSRSRRHRRRKIPFLILVDLPSGTALLHQFAAVPEPTDEQWHELRKRAKYLGYQLALFKRAKGIKPLLIRLDKLGTALGEARDLSLLRDYRCKASIDVHSASPSRCIDAEEKDSRGGWRSVGLSCSPTRKLFSLDQGRLWFLQAYRE